MPDHDRHAGVPSAQLLRRRRHFVLLAAASAVAMLHGVSSAPCAAAAPRLVREDDILRFEWVADPQISPDGTRVAFTRVAIDTAADEYRTNIWLVETAGGEPRQLTGGMHDAQPRWSPDGKTLAFVRAEDRKPGQLYLLPMVGGEAVALTSLKGGAGQAAW